MTRDEILNMLAGPEMDTLVAYDVMKWKLIQYQPTFKEIFYDYRHDKFPKFQWDGKIDMNKWHPTTDIAAAWEVVKKLNQKGMCVLVSELVPFMEFEEYLSACEITLRSDDEEKEPETVKARADTAPLAICRAALLALLDKQNGKA